VVDREALKKMSRAEQNQWLKNYLAGGPVIDFSKEKVYLSFEDGTYQEVGGTGRVFQANELDLRTALVFE